jgi:23S rRNA (adenine2503-C2)-methyltransferase
VTHPPDHIFAHTPDSLEAWCRERRMLRFRAAQILEWVYGKRVADPDAMSNLSKRHRETLARDMTFLSGAVVREQEASDGTRKLLMQWHRRKPDPSELTVLNGSGGPRTECVMIPALDPHTRLHGRTIRHPHPEGMGESVRRLEPRRTGCISSQVGCPVGCRFCASGVGGLEGNLSAGRIVEQVWRLNRMLVDAASEDPTSSGRAATPEDPRITHVVFMGMGEPLANFANVLHAVRTLVAPWGMGISARRITISTVGLPAAIERLAEQLDLPVTLALSLHAPNDKLRRELIPWAEYTTIADLLGACRKWFDRTGREITLEYTLLRGVNDRPEHAVELSRVAGTLRANVNLIRYNEVAGIPFLRPRTDDVREFQRLLRARGVNTHIRRSRGRDIAAACGQLRHEAAGA